MSRYALVSTAKRSIHEGEIVADHFGTPEEARRYRRARGLGISTEIIGIDGDTRRFLTDDEWRAISRDVLKEYAL